MNNNFNIDEPYTDSTHDKLYFGENAYSFIRSISSSPEEPHRKKRHKKIYAVIFLTVFSIVFVSVVRHTYINDSDNTNDNNEISNNYEYPQYDDNSVQKIYTDSEIDEKLRLLSQNDIRYVKIYENKNDYPNDMLQAICRNPEVVDFAVGYLTSNGSGSGEITAEELNEKVPLFIQWDSRWGYIPYGDNIIGLSGCGPTCLSMVAVSMTGNSEYSPSFVANYSMKKGYYEIGSGTTWSLFTEGCAEFGLRSEEIPLNYMDIVNSLDSGNLIICSMNPGDFTAVGHFIVIKGVEDGKLKINDPNSNSRSSKLWSYDELEWQIRNLWEFSLK